MTKNEILNYVMTTPENVNRQVLKYMLDELEGEGGGGSTVDVFYINFSLEGSNTIVMDKTMEEIGEAFEQGKLIYGNFLSSGIVDSLTPLYNIPASRVEKYTLNNIDYYGVWFEVTQISDGITYLSQLAALSESDTIECRTVSWTTEETTI